MEPNPSIIDDQKRQSSTGSEHTAQSTESENSIVCYCHRLTTGMLREAYRKCGSVKGVEESTRAGTACTGCKVMLHSLFGEAPSNHYEKHETPQFGTTCKKPGSRIMKGFVLALGDSMQSTIYSSNGIAPQLGSCDADTKIEWHLLNHRGESVRNGQQMLRTNETFVFRTTEHALPNPFFGIFLLAFERANYGASRFNLYWGNAQGLTSTHENSETGRPRVILPVAINKSFLNGPNTAYAAIYNPHQRTIKYTISVTDLESKESISWRSELAPFSSTWINANEHFFAPALKQRPESRFTLTLEVDGMVMQDALAMYFFFHNRVTNVWTANHL